MGERANYTFKFKNQYINNVYQHWGAMSGTATSLAELLFDESKNFENMEDVANFIVKDEFLEMHHFYQLTKKHNFKHFQSADEYESFVEKVKDNPYVFDSELIFGLLPTCTCGGNNETEWIQQCFSNRTAMSCIYSKFERKQMY